MQNVNAAVSCRRWHAHSRNNVAMAAAVGGGVVVGDQQAQLGQAIAVIVPVHNGAEHIEAALRSIAAQTHNHIQVSWPCRAAGEPVPRWWATISASPTRAGLRPRRRQHRWHVGAAASSAD